MPTDPTDAYEQHRRRLRAENGLNDDGTAEIIDLPDNKGFISSDGFFWIDAGDMPRRRRMSSTGLPVWDPEEPW